MSPAGTQAPWLNLRIISTLSLVFLAGVASGALGMQLGLHHKLHSLVATPAQPTAPDSDATLLDRFNSELQLSQDQSRKIAAVLADYSQYYQSLQDQLDDVRATGRTQIMQILNPDQRTRFEKIMNDLDSDLDTSRPSK